MTSGASISELKRRIKDELSIRQVVETRIVLRRQGHRYISCCPFHVEKTASFHVQEAQDNFHCFGCGANGDAIGFIMLIDNLAFSDAVLRISSEFGLDSGLERRAKPKPKIVEHRPKKDNKSADDARLLYLKSYPALGSPVEIYLRNRGLDPRKINPDILRQLRFNPAVPYYSSIERGVHLHGTFPAMLAPMQDRNGAIRAVHMTYLKPNGDGKLDTIFHPDTGEVEPAKKMRGSAWGCAIRLGPPRSRMAVAEGIETGLSFAVHKPEISVWVAGSVTNLAGHGRGEGELHPDPKRQGQRLPTPIPDLKRPGLIMPDGVRDVYVIKDNDSKDQLSVDAHIERFIRRMSARSIMARLVTPPAGCDLNDVSMNKEKARA